MTPKLTAIFTSCHFLQPLCSSGSLFLLNLFSVVLHQLQVTTEVSQEGKVIFSSLKTLCRLTCQKHVCPMFFNELFQHDRILWINFDTATSGKLKLIMFSWDAEHDSKFTSWIFWNNGLLTTPFLKRFLWLCIFTKCPNPVWRLRLDPLFSPLLHVRR